METLEKLFGSSARVKILRLFLMNPNEIFEKKDIEKKVRLNSATVTKELNILTKINLVKQKTIYKEKVYKNGKTKKIKEKGYEVNTKHNIYIPLQSLVIHHSPIATNTISNKISKHGKINLILVSGIFLQNSDSRLDLLIVGDSIRQGPLKNTITTMESEVGKSINYAIFDTKDFKYRLGIYDKLIRDVIDYPHEIVLDKIGL